MSEEGGTLQVVGVVGLFFILWGRGYSFGNEREDFFGALVHASHRPPVPDTSQCETDEGEGCI